MALGGITAMQNWRSLSSSTFAVRQKAGALPCWKGGDVDQMPRGPAGNVSMNLMISLAMSTGRSSTAK